MFKINILNINSVVTNSAEFLTEQECLNWYNSNINSFSQSHTYSIFNNSAEKESQEASFYLKNTDWYVIREMDSGVPCPQNIKDARALARSKVI